MTSVYYMSDLHLEFGSNLKPVPDDVPAGSVCVLAGDIITAKCLDPELTDARNRKQREAFYLLISNLEKRLEHILYVTGNHEYYGTSIQAAHELLRTHLPKSVTWLNDSFVDIGDTRFVGGTLWSSFPSPISEQDVAWGMNDFRGAIEWDAVPDDPKVMTRDFTTSIARMLHQETRAIIEHAARFHDGPVVAVTHHCPDNRCNPKQHRRSALIDGYCTDLTILMESIPNIRHWICGHTHHRTEFHAAGNCTVHMNCRGYEGHERASRDFSMDVCFEVGTAEVAA